MSAIRLRAKELNWPVPIHPPAGAAAAVFREWTRLYGRLRWALGTEIALKSNVRPNARFARLRADAKRRGLPVQLTLDEYKRLTACARCEYCGGPPPRSGHGIDRKDSLLGYAVANVVVACDACNRIKADIFRYEQMREIGNLIRAWRAQGLWSDPGRKDARRQGGRPVKGDLRQEIEVWNARWRDEWASGSLRLPFGADASVPDGHDIVREGFGAYSIDCFPADLANELDDACATAMGPGGSDRRLEAYRTGPVVGGC